MWPSKITNSVLGYVDVSGGVAQKWSINSLRARLRNIQMIISPFRWGARGSRARRSEQRPPAFAITT